mgnify:CR=1 FL=1
MGNGGSRGRRQQQQATVVSRATRAILHEEHPEPTQPPPSDALALIRTPRIVDTRDIRATQMRRGGQPFTKADLVAILARITGEPPERLIFGTCEELRIAVRVKLYTADPAAVVRPAAAAAAAAVPAPAPAEVPPPYAIEAKTVKQIFLPYLEL